MRNWNIWQQELNRHHLNGFYFTYEELKLCSVLVNNFRVASFYFTYEELKLSIQHLQE